MKTPTGERTTSTTNISTSEHFWQKIPVMKTSNCSSDGNKPNVFREQQWIPPLQKIVPVSQTTENLKHHKLESEFRISSGTVSELQQKLLGQVSSILVFSPPDLLTVLDGNSSQKSGSGGEEAPSGLETVSVHLHVGSEVLSDRRGWTGVSSRTFSVQVSPNWAEKP